MDPELEHLVADMSVVQTPAPQHNGGGLGNVRRNKPGMLDDDSTVTGQPFTVFSNGDEDGRQVPRVVNLMEGQAEILVNQSSNGKRVKLFIVPGWEEGFSTWP
jgi:hypothetical protein